MDPGHVRDSHPGGGGAQGAARDSVPHRGPALAAILKPSLILGDTATIGRDETATTIGQRTGTGPVQTNYRAATTVQLGSNSGGKFGTDQLT